MATGADVRDILELAGGDNDAGPISKKDIINSDKVIDKDKLLFLVDCQHRGWYIVLYIYQYSHFWLSEKDEENNRDTDL